MSPEVFSGVENDDAPLMDALAEADSTLFVVLRSPNLGADRMREIKTAFARHRRPEQRLVALRLELAADAALDRIVAELEDAPRPRSEISMVIAIEEVFSPAPSPAPAVEPVVTAAPVADVPVAPAQPRRSGPHRTPAPTGARASTSGVRPTSRRSAVRRRTPTSLQQEITGSYDYGEETVPNAISSTEPKPQTPPSRRGGLALLGALGMLAAAATGVAVLALPADSPEPAAVSDANSGTESSGRGEASRLADTLPVGGAIGEEEVVRIRVASPVPAEEEIEIDDEDAPDKPRRAGVRRREVARPSSDEAVPPVEAPVVASAAGESPEAAPPEANAPAPPEIPAEPAPLEDDVAHKLPR